MKKIKLILSLVCLISAGSLTHAQTLPEKLQNLSVTIHAGNAQGSGVIITRDNANWVLTAAHVVEDLKEVVSFHDNETGGIKKFSKFKVVTIVKELIKNGRSIGKTEIEADVVAYSSPKYGDDLCLLKLRDNITTESIKFQKTNVINPPGTKISHVGSFLGQSGSNSYSEGRISQIGRVLFDHVFDQADITGFPGSSGGGFYIQETGEYIGTIVRGAGQGYLLFVPNRRVKEWAKKHNVEFIFDENIKPGKIKLESLEPIDSSYDHDVNKFKKDFPYLIFIKDMLKESNSQVDKK